MNPPPRRMAYVYSVFNAFRAGPPRIPLFSVPARAGSRNHGIPQVLEGVRKTYLSFSPVVGKFPTIVGKSVLQEFLTIWNIVGEFPTLWGKVFPVAAGAIVEWKLWGILSELWGKPW